jgi:predicted transcriptional regulator
VTFPWFEPKKSAKAGICQKYRLYIESMSAKEILLEVAEKLPPDATLVDAIYELEFRQAVEEGLASLDRGERVPIEQVRAKIAEWAGK